MTKASQWITLFLVSTILVGCGFHLRGSSDFHHKSAWVSGNTQITVPLVKALKRNNVSVVNEAKLSEMQVELLKDEFEKRILSLGGTGQVTEYELYYRIHFRTKTNHDTLWSDVQTLESRRFFSYSNVNILSKQIEERQLNENMQQDVLNNLVRRLSALN